jgi:hypothetical protein
MVAGLSLAPPPGRATSAAMALEMRPNCERCEKALPYESAEARICSYECTFCADCSDTALGGKCPNCGGELLRRPIRRAR